MKKRRTKKKQIEEKLPLQFRKYFVSSERTTCHQCKLKTFQKKAKCGNCTVNSRSKTIGVYCGRCLKNRYKIDIFKIWTLQKKGLWRCPSCTFGCNCSFCRRKKIERK